LDDLTASLQPFNEAVAERTGRPVDDSAVRALTGAVLGVSISAMVTASQDPSADWIELMDTGLAHLEAGLDF